MKKYVLIAILFLSSVAFAKSEINLIEQSIVTAASTETALTAVVPLGKTVFVRKFGGLAPALQANTWSYVALQWGNGGGWETIRAGYGAFEYQINRDFIGDGTKQFRLLRVNKSGSTDLEMGAWINALIKD